MVTLRCPGCKSALIEIRFTLRNDAMVMRSCSRCDRRWWERAGEATDLDTVLTPEVDAVH